MASPVLTELVRSGKLTQEQVDWALGADDTNGHNAIQSLVAAKAISSFDAVQAGAAVLGLPCVDLGDVEIAATTATKLSGDQCRKLVVIPFAVEEDRLLVAVRLTKATDLVLRDDLRRLTGMRIQFVVADTTDIQNKINAVYRAESALAALAQTMNAEEKSGSDLDSLTEAVDEDPLVRFVNELIRQAIRDRASDIHIEPLEKDLRVRFRIDGVLHRVPMQYVAQRERVINRLKLMASMDIADRFKPQDGRLTVPLPGSKDGVVDLRVSALPTVWGEKIVMRILDNSQAGLSLSDLGFSDHNYERFSRSFTRPHGLILVTGPTGSGKSTTLYATINKIANERINVVTVEDPVEYRIEGINQVQVNERQGRSFAATLRSILRQDPDVILLGEIRDEETAEIAVTAALTGHLVLSTLHTNDAPSAVTRLTEMGVAPFLIGDAVDCVIAQRLLRRLCQQCRRPYSPTPEELTAFGVEDPSAYTNATFFHEGGCQRCSNTGFRGRIAAHEVMLVTAEIAAASVANVHVSEIGRIAAREGMTTMRQDAIQKAAAGMTTLDEVLRIAV